MREVYIWIFIILLPFLFGPILLHLLDIMELLPISTGVRPIKRKLMVTFLSVLVILSNTTKLVLIEKIVQPKLHINQFSCLLLKYLLGSLDLVLAPIIILVQE